MANKKIDSATEAKALTADEKEQVAEMLTTSEEYKNEAEAEAQPQAEAEAKTQKPKSASQYVYVFYCSPRGWKLRLSAGRIVTLNGCDLQKQLKNAEMLKAGKFGMTRILREDWEQIVKLYGKMKVFGAGRIFASDSQENGIQEAREKSGLVHGFEQIDPKKTATKPADKKKEE